MLARPLGLLHRRAVRSDERIPAYIVHGNRWSLPASLGCIQSHARIGAGLGDELRFERVVSPSLADVVARPPGVWLFADYLWSLPQNLALSRAIREHTPASLCIHGGASIPKRSEPCAALLGQEPSIDVAVRGEGEATAVELLARVVRNVRAARDWRDGLELVAGLTHRGAEGSLVRSDDRPRLRDLSVLASPFLQGDFEEWVDPQLRMVVLETNRGCPYGCTFCDWGAATQQKIHPFPMERVLGELDWIAGHRVPVVFLADANFGVLERDLEIAEHVAALRARTGFPCEVIVSYAKDGGPRVPEIVRTLVRAGVVAEGVISIQSTDPTVLRAVHRTNIRTASYEKLVTAYRREDLPVTTDLMVGLPGSTVASHKRDLQWCLDEDLVARCFPTVLLPNSPMGEPEYVREHGVRTHPSGVVASVATLSADELGEVWSMVRLYEIAEKATVLRYVLRYLQWEHGLPASELLHSLSRAIAAQPESFPAWLRPLDRPGVLAGVMESPEAFYGAVWRHVRATHGLALESDADRAIFQLNAAVVPRRGARYPLLVESPFDVLRYFSTCVAPKPGERRRLERLDLPLTFEIHDDEGHGLPDSAPAAVAVSSGLRVFELDWPGRKRALVAATRGGGVHPWRTLPAGERP